MGCASSKKPLEVYQRILDVIFDIIPAENLKKDANELSISFK